MKNLFYSMMCLSALALSFTACDDDDEKPNGGNDNGGGSQPTQLATPTLTAQGGKGTFTVKWAAVENAEGYTVSYGEKTDNVTATEYVAKNVAAGEYKVRVKATTTKEGYLDSEWAETTVTVEENGGGGNPGGEIGDGTWAGTWTVSATQKLRFTNEGSETVDEPTTFEINIAPQEFEGGLSGFIFTGWSKLTDDQGNPVPGAALLDEQTNTDLCLLSGFQVGETQNQDGSPVTIAWLAPGLVNGEQVQFITGQYPAIRFNMTDKDHATGTLFEGKLEGGGTFKSVALDVFAYDESSIYFMSDVTEFAAGEFTMTKTANAAQAPQKNYVKAFQAPSLLKNLKSIKTNIARLK